MCFDMRTNVAGIQSQDALTCTRKCALRALKTETKLRKMLWPNAQKHGSMDDPGVTLYTDPFTMCGCELVRLRVAQTAKEDPEIPLFR